MAEKTTDYTLLLDRYSDREGREYVKGDLIPLTEQDAERLSKHGAIEKPGTSEKREADELEARIERVKEEQKRLEEQRKQRDQARREAEKAKEKGEAPKPTAGSPKADEPA